MLFVFFFTAASEAVLISVMTAFLPFVNGGYSLRDMITLHGFRPLVYPLVAILLYIISGIFYYLGL